MLLSSASESTTVTNLGHRALYGSNTTRTGGRPVTVFTIKRYDETTGTTARFRVSVLLKPAAIGAQLNVSSQHVDALGSLLRVVRHSGP